MLPHAEMVHWLFGTVILFGAIRRQRAGTGRLGRQMAAGPKLQNAFLFIPNIFFIFQKHFLDEFCTDFDLYSNLNQRDNLF